MNPYNVLGVPHDADKADIRRAYRHLSHKHHPDKGGDDEAFKRLKEAYKILMDDDSRSHFDATGKVKGAGPNIEGMAVERIVRTFQQWLSRGNLSVNPVDYIIKQLNSDSRQLERGFSTADSDLSKLKKAKKRISTSKNDFIGAFIDETMGKVELAKNKLYTEEKVLKLANKLICDYNWEEDEEELVQYLPTGGPSFNLRWR